MSSLLWEAQNALMQQANPICQRRPPGQRAACRDQQGRELQREWLSTLTWGTDAISAAAAARIQRWLGIFPVNWRQLSQPALLRQQWQTLHEVSTGSFAQLLEAMLLDPALQLSLNGPSNHRRSPNENLARELLELFSLGEGHYSEQDVIEAARALTGYRLDNNQQLVLDPRRHDAGLKTILGRTDAFDARALAHWLADQPATARHITSRLWRSSIGTTANPQQVQRLAAAWRQEKLSLPWLFARLKQHPEAKASRMQGLRMADPLEMVSRSLRLLGSRHPEAIAISLRGLSTMGQAPFAPPSVKGWPINEQWLNLRWLQARRRTLQRLLANEEVWESRQLPAELGANLTSFPPLTIRLPAAATRENLALLWADPVWQVS